MTSCVLKMLHREMFLHIEIKKQLPNLTASCVVSSEMSCLMEALQDKRVRLQPECKKRLQDRIDMWSYAAKVREPHKNQYFLLIQFHSDS